MYVELFNLQTYSVMFMCSAGVEVCNHWDRLTENTSLEMVPEPFSISPVTHDDQNFKIISFLPFDPNVHSVFGSL